MAAAAIAAGNGGGYHGIIKLNLTDTSSLQAVVLHEVDEILGIGGQGSILNDLGTVVGGDIGSLDFYRYSAPGVRSFTPANTASVWFSIDGGTTRLVYFNQDSDGDYGDWGDGKTPADGQANNPPQVQDAFNGGNPSMGVNEFIALDVVGYTLLAPTPKLQNMTYSGNTFTMSWTALPGLSYQVQYTTPNALNGWTDVGDPVTAVGLTAFFADFGAFDSARFYRVIVLAPSGASISAHYLPQVIAEPSGPIINVPIIHHFPRSHQ